MTRFAVAVFGLLFSISTAAQTSTGQKSDTFPTENQINLLLTQAERAFDQYENAVALESETFATAKTKSGESALISLTKDRELLTQARSVLAALKKNPKIFNSPMGFLLIGNLDDASRNMALCSGQAGLEMSTDVMDNADVAKASTKLHLNQTCLDTSTLLYTVSETAFDMYSQYLSADYQLEQQLFTEVTRARDSLRKCTAGLKSQ